MKPARRRRNQTKSTTDDGWTRIFQTRNAEWGTRNNSRNRMQSGLTMNGHGWTRVDTDNMPGRLGLLPSPEGEAKGETLGRPLFVCDDSGSLQAVSFLYPAGS